MKAAMLLVMFSWSSLAGAQERQETIRQLMEAQGLIETFAQQIDLSKQQNVEQGRAAAHQVIAGLRPGPEFAARFDAALEIFLDEISAPWEAEEIVAVWAGYYGTHFTDAELEQLLAHYRRPLAQKEILAGRQAMVEFSNHLAETAKPLAEQAIGNFVARLQLIAKECNCRR